MFDLLFITSGKLSFEQVQAWALNRFYYQWSIPRKDLTLMARMNDVDIRVEWRSRVIDHEGEKVFTIM